ncbi:DUF5518 domain-containing protein, partial [Haloarcula sp. JP-Z28]|uniref:DUF5518 domain-containing protein n=1 Tax=Haloarcula sp. JP-Z28 TaxID=2716715 RepID=UPI001F03F818
AAADSDTNRLIGNISGTASAVPLPSSTFSRCSRYQQSPSQERLVKRHGGVGTAAGIRAGLIGGVPALWSLKELLVAIPTIPNPLWFRVVGVGLALVVGVLLLLLPMVVGGLAGRFGGWLSNRAIRGSPRRGVDPAVVPETGTAVCMNQEAI